MMAIILIVGCWSASMDEAKALEAAHPEFAFMVNQSVRNTKESVNSWQRLQIAWMFVCIVSQNR
jgi:hypothetical protein